MAVFVRSRFSGVGVLALVREVRGSGGFVQEGTRGILVRVSRKWDQNGCRRDLTELVFEMLL